MLKRARCCFRVEEARAGDSERGARAGGDSGGRGDVRRGGRGRGHQLPAILGDARLSGGPRATTAGKRRWDIRVATFLDLDDDLEQKITLEFDLLYIKIILI